MARITWANHLQSLTRADGGRAKESPRKRWLNNIKQDLKDSKLVKTIDKRKESMGACYERWAIALRMVMMNLRSDIVRILPKNAKYCSIVNEIPISSSLRICWICKLTASRYATLFFYYLINSMQQQIEKNKGTFEFTARKEILLYISNESIYVCM